jgi:N-acetylmuramoyl-L-alanine amidase
MLPKKTSLFGFCSAVYLALSAFSVKAGKLLKWNSKKTSLFAFCLAIYIVLLGLPAQAGKLLQWNFDARQNQLEFTTDAGVQPRAQLITNPTRLVIDLPGTKYGRKQQIEPIVNAPGVQSLRVGQFDPQTARLVVEMSPGYVIDPNQVKFEGVSPKRWRITLPTPMQQSEVQGDSTTGVSVPTASSPVFRPQPSAPALSARTQVQGFQVTGDGFFIRTSGDAPQIQVTKSLDGRQVYVELEDAKLASNARPIDTLVNQRGVSRGVLSQSRSNPPTVRLTLNVTSNSGEWKASSTPDGSGVIVIPSLGTSTPASPDAPSPVMPTGRLNTIQSVEIEGDRQLVVRSSDRLTFNGAWDRSSGGFRIVLPFSKLASNFRGPVLTTTSPLLQVKLRQDDPQTVSIVAFPATGVQLGELSQPSLQSLILQLRRSGFQNIPTPTPRPTFPRAPNGRQIVIIDPGHGGPDPGAVGIGGIQEKEIVLDISNRISAILEQQGVSTVLTRTADIDLDLAPRVEMADRLRATVFVSIHANSISMARPDINGLETYYYDSGYDLARMIHASVLKTAQIRDRGVRSARFYVLRKSSMPSVLVEVGFVTGAEDAANLANSGHRQRMAEGIARGILQYIRGGG